MKTPPLRWGIVGLGRIARKFADALKETSSGKLAAVASRTQESADKFAADYPGTRTHGSYQALFDDPEVDAVYIATPHPMHSLSVVRAAEAGKHILCEKPLALNAAEAMAAIHAARKHDVFLMEAFMYRCHPQTLRTVELIAEGQLGEVRLIEASFSYYFPCEPEARHVANHLGGGGILDVGCYPVSMSRLLAGAVTGKPHEEPLELKAVGHLHEVTGVDAWSAAVLRFPGDLLAHLSCGILMNAENVVRIHGTEGRLTLTSPWFCKGDLILRKGGNEEKIPVTADKSLYTYEIDAVAEYIGQRQSPYMSWEDTVGNMRVLDRWRKEIGLEYASESIEADWPTLDARPLTRVSSSQDASVRVGQLPGIQKSLSPLVLGTLYAADLPSFSLLGDEYFRKGGNVFDTARVYLRGKVETLLGRWMENRGVREDVVVIAKGAHTPHCDPENLLSQLRESLELLRTDYTDIYMMHRDNLEIPVGEFVDAIDSQVQSGRIHAYGFSNWTLPRVKEALAYARKHSRTLPACISNQASLARMVEPLWPDCISASTPDWTEWLEANHFANFAWSSQARGFFTKRSEDPQPADQLLSRCFYSPDNFERKKRAEELGREKGVDALQIAGAYVLGYGYPSFALIGPATLDEMDQSFAALEVKLTPEERRWLNLESDDR